MEVAMEIDARLLFSTFALIFLAELGDKTQLAALAASSGSRAPLSVFLGASAALVLSTLIAVLLGEALTRVVPPSLIRGGAGVLFLIFGALLLLGARTPATAAAPLPADAPPGALAGTALRLAAAFEAAAADDYRALAARAAAPELRTVLLALAREEESHLEHVRGLVAEDAAFEGSCPEPVGRLTGDAPEALVGGARLLAEAIRHERATAAFYEALSRSATVASLRAVFGRLAAEEGEHARRLEALIRG